MDPKPTPTTVEILSRATFVVATQFAADAADMIASGFLLVDISPGETGPYYSLIWTRPVADIPAFVRERHQT